VKNTGTFFKIPILRKVVIFCKKNRRFQVRKAYIDRSYVLNNYHHFPQIAKRVTAYPLQQFFPSGKMRGRRPRRWQQSCHLGGEAARGSAQPTPPASQSLKLISARRAELIY
ncbi:hypothetical protein NQ317_007418, partial [Molorchus minor]